MSESTCSNFLEKYKNIFANYHFKFKGLSPKTEELYIQLVKDLGAEVSNNASHILTDELYMTNVEDNECPNLYNITYIVDSIQAGEPLDINSYKFECGNSLQLYNDILINKEITESINDEIRLNKSIESNECFMDEVDNNTNVDDIVNDVLRSSNNINKNQLDIVRKRFENKVQKNINENICDNKPSLTTSVNIKENSNLEEIKLWKNLDNVKNNSGNKIIEIINIESDEESIDNINDGNSSKSSDLNLFLDSEEDDVQIIDKLWWKKQKWSDSEICTIRSCSYEPEPHEKHDPPRRFMSLTEKRILLKYLISTNTINEAKGIKVFKKMHEARYLVHRSLETLRRCVRQTILPNITSFNLPPHILNKFLQIKKRAE